MHARLRGPSNLLILHQIINRTDFSCLADELAEQSQHMNIKVTASKYHYLCKYDVVGGRAPFLAWMKPKSNNLDTVRALAKCWGVPLRCF